MDEKKTPKVSNKKPRKKQNPYTRNTPKEKEIIGECLALAIIPETEEERVAREKREAEAENERTHEMFERQAKAFGIQYERRGAPSKFTEATVQKILTALAIGATLEESANYAGVTRVTLYNYFTRFPEFEALATTMRTKTPLKTRRITNYYFDQTIKKIDSKQEVSVDDFKLAYGYLRDKYPREFSKGIGGGMLGSDDDSIVAPIQVTNNTVNMIFSNTLKKSQFLKE